MANKLQSLEIGFKSYLDEVLHARVVSWSLHYIMAAKTAHLASSKIDWRWHYYVLIIQKANNFSKWSLYHVWPWGNDLKVYFQVWCWMIRNLYHLHFSTWFWQISLWIKMFWTTILLVSFTLLDLKVHPVKISEKLKKVYVF